jgi:hypothetical protein
MLDQFILYYDCGCISVTGINTLWIFSFHCYQTDLLGYYWKVLDEIDSENSLYFILK